MSEEPKHKNRGATNEELAAIHAATDIEVAKWKADLAAMQPSPESIAEYSKNGQKYTAELAERHKKTTRIRQIYTDLYVKNREVWNKGKDARIAEVFRILESEGMIFTDGEKIKISTWLEASTVTMKLEKDEDEQPGDADFIDVPIYPAS